MGLVHATVFPRHSENTFIFSSGYFDASCAVSLVGDVHWWRILVTYIVAQFVWNHTVWLISFIVSCKPSSSTGVQWSALFDNIDITVCCIGHNIYLHWYELKSGPVRLESMLWDVISVMAESVIIQYKIALNIHIMIDTNNNNNNTKYLDEVHNIINSNTCVCRRVAACYFSTFILMIFRNVTA